MENGGGGLVAALVRSPERSAHGIASASPLGVAEASPLTPLMLASVPYPLAAMSSLSQFPDTK
ncbi:MAG: hypothetical protein Fur0025_17010 [Oscillatoriaceae cyanobacterium]